jgi:predicted PurR-regulated permease PerM
LANSKAASGSKSLVLIAFVLAIAALYFGRELFIPLALAFVLSFLLTPIVSLLEKTRIGRVASVLTVLILSFVLVGGMTWGVARQLVEIMVQLPDYKANLDEKIKLLHASNSGNLSKATASIEELNKELAAVPGQIASAKQEKEQNTSRTSRPIPVQVAQPASNLVQDLRGLLGPLAGPLETAAIVIIFTLFMLAKREDLRNRAIRLAGHGQLNLMTQALDDAGRRLSRYLVLQFAVNACYGAIFGLALYFIGIPHALLWGVFAGVLRFVPYVGTLIAVALPVALALAVFPGWHHAGLVFLVFVVMEVTVANFIEPLLYGSHTGISSLAILVAAVFWATIWGPVGLILSTPLTVCLIVLGRHVPQLNFLEVLLGDEPVLLPEQRFYQRLLAMDQEEARSIAENHLKENSLETLYESIILPALKLAEHDHQTEGLDDTARRFMFRNVRELIEDLGDQYADERAATGVEDGAYRQPARTDVVTSKPSTACIAANSGADELVTMMLVQLLEQSGIRSRQFRAELSDADLAELSKNGYAAVCISSISPFAVGEARWLCRRLRAGVSALPVVIGLWSFESNRARQRLGPACSGLVSTTLGDALAQIRQLMHPSTLAETPAETLAESPAESRNAQKASV